MQRLICVVGALVAVALAACSGISTRSNYDSQAVPVISRYRTYGWFQYPEGYDIRVNSKVVESQVIRAVDNSLSARGYRRTSDNPDFLVGWYAAIEGKVDITTIDTYYGSYRWGRRGGWPGGPVRRETYVRPYKEGTLILDIIDAQSGRIVWHGSAQTEIEASAPAQKRNERINKAVEKILEDFPP